MLAAATKEQIGEFSIAKLRQDLVEQKHKGNIQNIWVYNLPDEPEPWLDPKEI